jgi:hypothetical protein
MEGIDLAKTIKEATATFCQNRIGDKPPISVTVPSMITDIPWPDRKLQELVKLFLYETLLTNDPDAEVTVSLRRRSELRDLSEFVGVQPSYWLHLRISGRGVRLSESLSTSSLMTLATTARNESALPSRKLAWAYSRPPICRISKSSFAWTMAASCANSICCCRCASRSRFPATPITSIDRV